MYIDHILVVPPLTHFAFTGRHLAQTMFSLTFLACPMSTYKDNSEVAASCKHCPPNSGHQRLGSITLSDCECLTGYWGQPENGIPCESKSF